MLLYSEIFKKMEVSKEVAWAIIRILKGDFFSFKKMIKLADSSKDIARPQKKFIKLISAMAGAKNTDFVHIQKRAMLPYLKVIELYCNLSSD